jgi:general secretion pathway protein F
VSVREGGRLHSALAASGQFPPLMVHMVSAGEGSGELESMLERAATQEERELESTVTAATSLMEPVLILVMGGVVLVIVLAILLPIFEMNQLVG